jgi:hypothetical protein
VPTLRWGGPMRSEHLALVPSSIPRLSALLTGVVTNMLLLAPARADAQERGAVAGTVVTSEDRPAASAQIRIVGVEQVVVANDQGHFRFIDVVAGRQTLDVRLVGYGRLLLPVEIGSGSTHVVHVTLVREPLGLDTVEVTARRYLPPGLRSFEERQSRGGGHFFTREQIAKMNPRVVTDVLRRVPGVQIQPTSGPYGASNLVRMGRATGGMGARPCPVLFYVNGSPFPLTADLAINQFIVPDDIEAIEVYTGTSRIPLEFSSNMHNSRCGVIAIWTRIGTHGRTAP